MKRPSVFFFVAFICLLLSSGSFTSFILCFGAAGVLSVLVRLLFQLFLRLPVPKNSAVLITGCSSGFGEAFALRLAKMGLVVFAGVRSEAEGERLTKQSDPKHQKYIVPIILDVTSKTQVAEAVTFVTHYLQTENISLQYLVNNAGIMEVGTFEEIDEDRVKAVFDVNFFGPVRVTKAFLPLLKSNEVLSKCRIVNMGSFTGLNVLPLFGTYGASKYSIEALSDQMRIELPIPTVLIEAGSFKTGVTDALHTSLRECEQTKDKYPAKLQRLHRLMAISRGRMPDPKPVVDLLEYALFSRFPPNRALVGYDAIALLCFLSWLPDSVVLGIYKALFF